MNTEAPEILLAHYLKALKLPTFQREHQKLARLCATEGVDHVGYLFRLAERETIERDRRKVERRIKAAKFPVVKSLDSFDFTAIPKLNKMQVLELSRCEWIERRENVIALGPSGTGKTHVALGLGLAACQKGLSVGFTTAAALVSEMMEARGEITRAGGKTIYVRGIITADQRPNNVAICPLSVPIASWFCETVTP